MTSTIFYDTDTKIAKLSTNGIYPVQNRSALYLVKRGRSQYFEGRFRGNSCQVGVWKKEIKVSEAIDKWQEIKRWCKEHNRSPKSFNAPLEESPKTFSEVVYEWFEEVYKPQNKARTWRDRENKINQMVNYLGRNLLISDLELDKGGRERIKKMLKDLYESRNRHYVLVRCRQLLTRTFDYAEEERYIRHHQNPLYKRFQWEGIKHQKKGSPTLAKTITSKSWGEIPRFLQSINANACKGEKLTDLAVKAHLLLCIRSGVVVRLKWEWIKEVDGIQCIVVPADTEGLKRKKGDTDNIHHIPITPELNSLLKQIKEITGWQEYVFYSFNGKNYPHLGEETINDHLKNLDWYGRQSAQGWRDVITTATLEHTDFDYEIIDRQLGRLAHKQGTRGHYDESTLLEKRRRFMHWWTQALVNQGLEIA